MFSYIIIGVLTVLLSVSIYMNINLYRKIIFFETWYENLAETVEVIYENMQIMDERGVMENDDEFARFFISMREMMLELFSMGFYNAEDLENVELDQQQQPPQ